MLPGSPSYAAISFFLNDIVAVTDLDYVYSIHSKFIDCSASVSLFAVSIR